MDRAQKYVIVCATSLRKRGCPFYLRKVRQDSLPIVFFEYACKGSRDFSRAGNLSAAPAHDEEELSALGCVQASSCT
jgi:hypothetical protein